MEKRKKQGLDLSQAQVLRQDLRLFSVLAAPEEDFLRLEAELKADPLFARLCAPGTGGDAPVVRRKFAGASYAFSYAVSDAALAAAASGASAGEWLSDRPAMAALAGRVGEAAFSEYFLSGRRRSVEESALACGISEAQTAALRGFADAFILAHERTAPAALPAVYLRCAAKICAEEGRLYASYLNPSYFRGAYVINGPAFSRLLKSGGLSRQERARARALASMAQRLSWRKDGLHRALSALMEAQADFLSGRGPLKPLSQRQLADRLGLNPGTLSRLIALKTVIIPGGEEIKLRSLFFAKKDFVIGKIMEVLGEGGIKMTDAALAAALRAGYGLKVSRRSVNLYRKNL